MKLEIGGGTLVRQGWLNLDPVHGTQAPDLPPEATGHLRRRLEDGIPLPDGSVTEARASHVMEHIAAGPVRIVCMNEVHRVLQVGGSFEIVVPVIGFTDGAGNGQMLQGWRPYADPTHVSFWWWPESLMYFTGELAAHADYGIAPWRLESHEVSGEPWWEGRATLVKVGG